ncbi:MAG: hypothetical protein RIC83_11970 [Alphaproteobacteria bacterium]
MDETGEGDVRLRAHQPGQHGETDESAADPDEAKNFGGEQSQPGEKADDPAGHRPGPQAAQPHLHRQARLDLRHRGGADRQPRQLRQRTQNVLAPAAVSGSVIVGTTGRGVGHGG